MPCQRSGASPFREGVTSVGVVVALAEVRARAFGDFGRAQGFLALDVGLVFAGARAFQQRCGSKIGHGCSVPCQSSSKPVNFGSEISGTFDPRAAENRLAAVC